MKAHFASIWETVADAIPDAPALLCAGVGRSWRDYEDRAARIAAALAAGGTGPDAKVGIYAGNCNEYLEAQFGIFKVRGVPVNVNWRYTESELVYLLDNAEASGVFFEARFAPRIAAIRAQLPALSTFIEIDDGSGEHLSGSLPFEDLIATHAPHPRADYSEDDIYMLYTGGTTGMPKGVIYRLGDFSPVSFLGYERRGLAPPTSAAELVETVRRLRADGATPVSLPACPLMHGTGLWIGAFLAQGLGGRVVLMRGDHFDADSLWRTVAAEKVTDVVIVGDAFARPMLAALERARDAGAPHDLASVKLIVSSGVMFSREVKQGLLEFADMAIVDIMGSTEGGMGSSVVSRLTPPSETARFLPNPDTKVFNALDEEVEPGSDEIGMVASGTPPVAYFKDAAKSAATFRTIKGVRYSFPGDFAKVAADGSLILLGRGSVCINSGGEKIFPEEVEEALKAHPDVFDCLVVGVPDARFGERVTAVLSLRDGRTLDEAGVMAFARDRIAGYKVPRRVVQVGAVQRAPNGKADYPWARKVAAEAARAEV